MTIERINYFKNKFENYVFYDICKNKLSHSKSFDDQIEIMGEYFTWFLETLSLKEILELNDEPMYPSVEKQILQACFNNILHGNLLFDLDIDDCPSDLHITGEF